MSPSSIQSQPELELSFSTDVKIKDYLKQLNGLGKLSTTYILNTTAYIVNQQKNINIKVKEDKATCDVVGSCFTDDGSLLLADIENFKLKRLDVSTDTIIDNLDLEARPIAVCFTSNQEAAVSLENYNIQFVSLGEKMTATRKLKMDHFCLCLAFNDGNLIISDAEKTVYFHDIYGTMLHKVQTEKSGNQIFSETRQLYLSKNKDCVYVSDFNKGLITLDIQGKYLSTFTDPDLVGPHRVCTDKRGNILVCGHRSSNIVQISEDSNTKLGIIKTKKDQLSVCFGPHQNKLAVTHWFNKAINVYKLD